MMGGKLMVADALRAAAGFSGLPKAADGLGIIKLIPLSQG
jgi:hypothetical protein